MFRLHGIFRWHGYLLTIFAVHSHGICAQQNDELTDLFGDKDTLTLATGYRQTLTQAPTTATVITADEIDALGQTRLIDILNGLPGFHGLFRFQGDALIFRGIQTAGNQSPDVLFLVDGVPQSDVHFGTARTFMSEVPLTAIARIETIRGPYSVRYGRDAFSGVVNIITWPPTLERKARLDARVGTFNTAELRWDQRFAVADGLHLAAQLRTTKGHEPRFATDRQTALDAAFGTNASLAPRDANTSARDYSILADLQTSDVRWRFRARGRRDGLGVGVVSNFDPDGALEDEQYNVEVSYRPSSIGDWEWNADTSFLYYAYKPDDWMGFPPNAFPGFTEGVFDSPFYKEAQARFTTGFTYSGFESHTPQAAVGIEYVTVFDVEEFRNFVPDPITGLPATPLPEATRVPENQLYSREEERTVVFALVDDTIALSPDWTLTAGARIDWYSDVGVALSPRLSLVWTPRTHVSAKLLLGRGFRAPTFIELYGQNNLSTLGSDDLEPPTIDSAELALEYAPSSAFDVGLSLFAHRIRNPIVAEPTPPVGLQAANGEEQVGYGVELSSSWKATEDIRLETSYSFQANRTKDSKQPTSLAPRHKVYARADWRLAPRWRLNVTGTFVRDRKRVDTDTRDAPPNYALFDATLAHQLGKDWTMRAVVNNIFDKDALVPDDPNEPDIPLPGRAFFFDASYRF